MFCKQEKNQLRRMCKYSVKRTDCTDRTLFKLVNFLLPGLFYNPPFYNSCFSIRWKAVHDTQMISEITTISRAIPCVLSRLYVSDLWSTYLSIFSSFIKLTGGRRKTWISAAGSCLHSRSNKWAGYKKLASLMWLNDDANSRPSDVKLQQKILCNNVLLYFSNTASKLNN